MVPFGTDETIRRIVSAYSDMLLRLACTRLGSTADAEDAVQEAFLRLLTARPAFRDEEHEKAWLIRTTLHRASDLRRQAERRNVPLEDVSESAGEETADRGRAVREAVQALPEKYRQAVYLRYYEEYEVEEIAALMGCGAPQVSTYLYRGRQKLKTMLGGIYGQQCLSE